jgi:hypothetical protein
MICRKIGTIRRVMNNRKHHCAQYKALISRGKPDRLNALKEARKQLTNPMCWTKRAAVSK